MDEKPGQQYDIDLAVALKRLPELGGLQRRAAVESLWRRIANGTAPKHTVEDWAQHVARELVSKIIDYPSLDEKFKGSEALRSVGLFGRRTADAVLMGDLDWVIGTAEWPGVGRQGKLGDVVGRLREMGHFKGVSEKIALRKVQYLLKALPPA